MGRKRKYETDADRQAARRRAAGILERPKMYTGETKEDRREQHDRARIKKWRTRPIIGIDGEGRDTEDGHILTLLAAGNGEETYWIERNGDSGLTTIECLEFLFRVKERNKDGLFVIFAGSYDFTMILKSLTENDIRNIYEAGETYVYLNSKKYRIKVVQRKLLQLSRYNYGEKKPETSMTIYDVFGFFQSSFIRALIDWKIATEEQLETMQAMKNVRNDFGSIDFNAIRAYNEQEIKYLVLLVEKLRNALDDCNMHISSWHGAGAIAGHIMKQRGITRHIVRAWEEPIETAVKTAYFGGRIQLLKAGSFEHAYGHDIVSAYPSAHQTLPSPRNCRVSHVEKDTISKLVLSNFPWSVWRVRWNVADGTPLQPFPLRQEANIYYQQSGEGWYWYPEVATALKHFGKRVEILEGYVFHPQTDEKPFAYINELFTLRKHYKATGNAAEKPLKLGYNSHYGKHAQHSERGAKDLPVYQCYWYAGYITSVCRAKVLDLCMRDPYSIVAIATDGVFATKKLTKDDEVGTNLGDWEQNDLRDFFIVQPGIYQYTDDEGKTKCKTRGLHPKEVNWTKLREMFFSNERVTSIDISFATERFIGLKTACARNNIGRMGTWERGERSISLLLHPTRAVTDGKIQRENDNAFITYYQRLEDGMGRKRPLHISQPFSGRYDPENTTAYVAELGEIDDNPELWNG